MPAPQPAQPQQDPTVQDLIRQEAQKQGVPPELALAVGEQESGFNPTVTGPRLTSGEQGIGTFQLLPSTAKRLGVDPTHPIENIRGGVSYLKELLDQHNGNLEQVLKSYGGVKTDQSYVPGVLGRLQKFSSTQPPQPAQPATPQNSTSGVGSPPPQPSDPNTFVGPPTPPETWTQWGVRQGRQVLESFDPRQPAGRRNLMGAAGAAAGTAAVVGTAPVSAPVAGLAAATAGVLGAVGGGMAAESGEQIAGTAPPSGRNALLAGGEQGLYEAAGHAVLWPVRAVGRRMIASRVGRYAAEGLSATKQATLGRLQSALDSAQAMLRVTKADAQEANELTRTGTRAMVGQAAGQAKAGVEQAGKAGEAGVATATQPYDQLVGGPPPSAATAGRQVNRTIQEGGPARARTLAGQAVESAAESGPDVDLRPVKAELEAMAERMRPSTVGGEAAPSVAGMFGSGSNSKEQAAFLEKLRASGVGVEETHPLPGVLRQIQEAPDTISFLDAHKYKRMLDDAVNWQSPAKKQLQGITKGIRGELRDTMTGHAPYDTATAAYAKIAPLYTQGVAPKLRKLAVEEPEAIVRLINPKQPTRAKMLVDLLTTQAEAGGDQAGGQAALESVQAAWVHQKVIQGGIEKLGQRIDAIPPEFRAAFLGDAKAQRVLSNLQQIQIAYQSAVSAGEAGVEQATRVGQAGVQQARTTGEGLRASVRQSGRQAVEQAAGQVPPARQALREGKQAAKGREAELAGSSLGPTLQRSAIEHTGADLLRAVVLAPRGSIWGAVSIARLLHGPTARDLIRWAAYSPTGTRAFVKAITSPAPDLALADLARTSGILGEATDRVTGKPPAPPAAVQSKGAPIGTPPPPPH